jgi:uncharacterized protein YdcH (DUF465 family)
MLGEDHSLANEFPDYLDTIKGLVSNDAEFAKETKRYNALDKEIRVLELQGGPIEDEAMVQLKLQRAELKDALYQRLQVEQDS